MPCSADQISRMSHYLRVITPLQEAACFPGSENTHRSFCCREKMAKLGTGQLIHHLTVTCSQILLYRTNVHSAPYTLKHGQRVIQQLCTHPGILQRLFQDYYLKTPTKGAISGCPEYRLYFCLAPLKDLVWAAVWKLLGRLRFSWLSCLQGKKTTKKTEKESKKI